MKRYFAVLISLCLLCGCTGTSHKQPVKVKEGEELMCICDTQEDAEKIAEQYEIILVSWQDKVAVYHTGQDPEQVIREGRKNGWPELSLNLLASH